MRTRLFLSLLLLTTTALAAPAPPPATTLTFPQFKPGESLHMVAYGDMRFTAPTRTDGTNPRVRKWLAEQVGRQNPAAILLTGDMPYFGSRAADWRQYALETASWNKKHALVLPAIGNHELYGSVERGLANYFHAYPQLRDHRYYSALLGSVEVISLDCTTSTDKTGEQAAWFGEQLDRIPPQVEFLVILDHYPWMADWQSQIFAHLPDKPALVLREVLEAHLPKLQAKVLVFNGHIHNYERFQRNGVTYVVTGGGGAQPYPVLIRGGEDQYLDKGFPVYHYLTIDVVNHQLHAVMWKVKDPEAPTLDVEAKDQFTLTYTPRREQGSSGP